MGLKSHDTLYIVLSIIHCLFICAASNRLLQGQGDVLYSLQAVLFKSHCSLSLDPNTVYLAFRYSLLSFLLNLTVHLFIVHHGLLQGFIFLPVFLSLVCIISMFIVQVFTATVQFYQIQSSASVFTDSLSSWVTGFLLLSHWFHTCSVQVPNHTQFLMAFCYIYNFPPYIYISTTSDYIY